VTVSAAEAALTPAPAISVPQAELTVDLYRSQMTSFVEAGTAIRLFNVFI
jgi:hypothetical protein